MDQPREDKDGRSGADEPPPFGRSWTSIYTAVLLALALLIVAFSAITRHFA